MNMQEKDKDIQMMERIRLFTEQPELISEQQAREWLADQEFLSLLDMHLDARRAAVRQPDSHEAFQQFKDKHALETDSSALIETLNQKPRARRRTLWTAVAGAVADCALLVVGFTFYKKYQAEQFEQRMLQAQAVDNDLTIYVGNEAMTAAQTITTHHPTANTRQQAATPFIINGNEIKVNASAMSENDVYEKTTLIVPDGKVAKLLLPDGSVIHLNAGSRIIFPPKFTDNQPRRVRLVGEAYFAVTHDEKRPFIVECGDMQTTVLGTEFNICNYEGETPHVTLVKGSVRVSTDKRQHVLRPGEDAAISGDEISTRQVYLDPIVAWKNGVLYFNEIPLKEILHRLSRTFNLELVMGDSTTLTDKIHLVVDKEEGVSEIVERLNLLSNHHITVANHQLIVE